MDDTENGNLMAPCMDLYKAKIQSDGILDKLNLRILVREDLQNKEIFRDAWDQISSTITLNYFFVDFPKHKARVH